MHAQMSMHVQILQCGWQRNCPGHHSLRFHAAGNVIVDGIAASNHVIMQEPGLIIDDPVAYERLKYVVRAPILL